MNNVNEKDWKLFKKLVPVWQEKYIQKINKEYIKILSKNNSSAQNFWELENRIRQDKKHPGVILDLRRSTMHMNLMLLLSYEVITFDDLKEFSIELLDELKR